ncbi:PREDICTED: protein HEXIM [Dinoponera quadriceps]|uniref:Protein HEXIM n=1 Tax=Dinoponera quadriceps TaxID=609295 RepID=A0A6P3WSP4_DINQU|nr:PREDICTED: protein HEXIM [Dinoponera quadriceps]XP_014469121.1 PREDICTED: protein HEXIM [Dinoponera quadriceps]
MEIHRPERTTEKVSGGIDGDTMGVKAEPMPAASSLPVPKLLPRSVGGNTNNLVCSDANNLKNVHLKSLANTYGRLESGSGSGDQDGGQHEDGVDIAAKKRRTRRGKPKHRKLKPYSKQQLSCQQHMRSRYIGRIVKTGRTQPPAPYNTTQFLMDDHSDLPDLEQKLSEAASLEVPAMFQKPPAPPRTRDSSFSVDSDEDYFYSSPEDEEEFLTKEFSNAYEDLHAERLSNLSKSQLIQEYLQLETRMDVLRQRGKNFHQMEERDAENKTTDSETAKKLKLCQQRIDDLLQQNEQLRRENEVLRTKKILRASSSESSVDSESDSDSSSNSNKSRCSCSLSSPGTSPKNAYNNSRLDNNCKADSKEDSCGTGQSDGSPRACTTPTNLSNGHATMSETKSFPT